MENESNKKAANIKNVSFKTIFLKPSVRRKRNTQHGVMQQKHAIILQMNSVLL